MRKSIYIPASLALSLLLTVPVLAQTAHQQHVAPADAAKTAPAIDPDKAYLLHQEYVSKTAELRGKLTAKQAELETLLATKPQDEAAVKKLTSDISALRGALFEQTTLFRIRFAKETGMPIRMTHGFGAHGGQMMEGMMGGGMGGMMGGGMGGMMGGGMECMGGKGGMMMEMGKGMDMGKGMTHDMNAMPKVDDAAKAPADAKTN